MLNLSLCLVSWAAFLRLSWGFIQVLLWQYCFSLFECVQSLLIFYDNVSTSRALVATFLYIGACLSVFHFSVCVFYFVCYAATSSGCCMFSFICFVSLRSWTCAHVFFLHGVFVDISPVGTKSFFYKQIFSVSFNMVLIEAYSCESV